MKTKLSILFWIIQNRPQILTENVDKEGVSHSTLSQDTHQPTYEEIKNIEDGKAL